MRDGEVVPRVLGDRREHLEPRRAYRVPQQVSCLELCHQVVLRPDYEARLPHPGKLRQLALVVRAGDEDEVFYGLRPADRALERYLPAPRVPREGHLPDLHDLEELMHDACLGLVVWG